MSVYINRNSKDGAARAILKDEGKNFILRWWKNAVRSWQRRKMIAALRGLDDQILRDIGIHPMEIESFVDSLNGAELRMTPIAPQPALHDLSYAGLRRAA